MKAAVAVLALGVALSGCASVEKSKPQTAAIAPPAAVAATPLSIPQPAQPGPWRIRKTEWTAADEKGFGDFVRAIAQSGCTTTIACMQSAANPYRDSDPPTFLLHADCAKWVYLLRAYYASKNGLPFSYVSRIAGEGGDLRFSPISNVALERRDIVDSGAGIDTASVLQLMHDEVYSATYRMDPADQSPLEQDFYSPKIQPGSIRAGTAIYDINGHVMIVYDVTADGSILYMDANPDMSVSRGAYGPQVPKSDAWLGGGFKNFRPMKLVGAVLQPDGTYIGGQVVLAANDAIPDYSLEQYAGNVAGAKAGDATAQFRYNNASLNLYEYARASMSNGGFAYNPVYELQVSLGSLCQQAHDDSRDADARVEQGYVTLYTDLTNDIASWRQRDLRVVYHGPSFKDALAETYAAQRQACAASGSGDARSSNPLDRFAKQPAAIYIQQLIAQTYETAAFDEMRPVGQ